MRRQWWLGAAVAVAVSCGGIRMVSKDGYRATMLFSPNEKYEIAVRGELKRVEGSVDGSPMVKILRPDAKKVWQFRPASRRLLESSWSPEDEIVPGYPVDPHFDSKAYADRFHASIDRIADGVQAGHPCDRYQMDLPSGDRVTIWVARDLERIPVHVTHAKPVAGDEYRTISDVQLVDIRVGADPELFERPKGYTRAKSYDELKAGK